MKKVSHLFLLTITLLAIVFSCKKNNLDYPPITVSTDEFTVPKMFQILKDKGFNVSNITIEKDRFIYEGDMVIPFDAVPELKKQSQSTVQLRAWKYPNPCYVSVDSAASNIKIFVDSSAINLGYNEAINIAIANWNNVSPNCAVHYTRVYSSDNANTIVSTYNLANERIIGYCGARLDWHKWKSWS